jgi:hypothetical protein
MKAADLPASIHRVGRAPNPFAWPEWAFAGPDGTFGNRFDDPQATYRVLYSAGERVGAYVETLARFRPDPVVFAALEAIDDAGNEPMPPHGVVPAAWLASRAIGTGTLTGSFVDLGVAQTLAILRVRLAARLVHYDIADLDGVAIRLTVPRRFTQEISRIVYETSTAAGTRTWDGISYLSRLGDDLRNWATFEPHEPGQQRVEPADRHDPALEEALAILGLELETGA